MDLRNETRAARVIQGAWRRYKLQKDIELTRVRVSFFYHIKLLGTLILLDLSYVEYDLRTQQKNLAATKIQALVRNFILRRRMFRQNKAAIKIQTFWRGYSAREKLRVLKKERDFALQNAAATVIQVCLGTFAPVLFPPSDGLHLYY